MMSENTLCEPQPDSASYTVKGALKEAPAIHYNVPLLVFSFLTTFKSMIAAAGEPISFE